MAVGARTVLTGLLLNAPAGSTLSVSDSPAMALTLAAVSQAREGGNVVVKRVFLVVVLFLLFVAAPGRAETLPEPAVQSILSAFMSYTDLRIASVQRSLEILASTSEARSGEWDSMRELLAGYQASDEGLIVWYVRPDGTYYTLSKGLVDVTLSDRSYFPDLMAGRPVVGALVISRSTDRRSAVIAVPVMDGDVVLGAIGATLFLDDLSEQIDSVLALGPGTTYFALNHDGLTTLHRRVDRHFLDPRELGSEPLKTAVEEMLSATSGQASYEFDDSAKTAVYTTSPLTQWRFAIATSDVSEE